MQLSNFFVKNSSLRHIGLNRFMYYENATGDLVSPAVPTIYIVLIAEGCGRFNHQELNAGDVFAYGFNMHPLQAETHHLTFLGIELEYHLFYQLTGLLPAFCQDVLLLEPKNPFAYFFNNQLLYFPIKEWVLLVEAFVRKRMSYHYKPFDIRTERLMYATKAMQQQNCISLDHLTSQMGISSRALQRDFSSILGISPKQYQGVHRVYLAAEYIKHRKLNEVAYLAGYTDQAHMNRDFKRYAGITPNQVNMTHKNNAKLYLAATPQAEKRSGFILPY